MQSGSIKNRNHETAVQKETLEGLGASQRATLAEIVADVFTISKAEAYRHIAAHNDEAFDAYVAFVTDLPTMGSNALQWRSSVMATLPLENWVPLNPQVADSPCYVKDDKYKLTSLKYFDDSARDVRELGQIANRKLLSTLLYEAMPSSARNEYGILVKWRDEVSEGQQPHAADCMVYRMGFQAELDYDEAYMSLEKHVRKNRDSEEATNPEDLPRIASAAAALLRDNYFVVGKQGEPLYIGEPANDPQKGHPENTLVVKEGQFLLSLLINVSANRVLLERARLHAKAEQASAVISEFLGVLNHCGVKDAPSLEHFAYSQTDIRTLLTAWFGVDGVTQPTLRGWNTLMGDDLELVMRLGPMVQDHYQKNEGKRRRNRKQYASVYDSFLFIFVVAACHVMKVKVPDGYARDKSSKRQAVPGPSKGKGLESRMFISAEALTLMKRMYGQLLYGLDRQELNAEGPRAYARKFAFKHAQLQEFIFLMLKRSSPELLHELNMVFVARQLKIAEAAAKRKELTVIFLGDVEMEDCIDWPDELNPKFVAR